MSTLAQTPVVENPFVIFSEPPRAEALPAGRKSLVPRIPLQDGEQYRFHFDMSKCVGCKCCEVACAEQNNNPPDVSWRRVGEVESGVYPFTQRLHLSMGCNHCLDPSCMKGCPTQAYHKDEITGIVLHDASICIGCEYCIWNCPYSVPVLNRERGVVGKCDMCHGRLTEGDDPACVNACPSEALSIEIVNIEEWRHEYAESANAPGLPSADDTISTTRVTLPGNLPPGGEKADYHRVRPESPHWSLVIVTVMSQLSAGGVIAAWLLQLLGGGEARVAAVTALLLGLASLLVAPLHLGRPAYAFLAIRNWQTSWLSREILALSGFGATASLFATWLWLDSPATAWVGAAAALLGIVSIYSSSHLYLVSGRPAWNSLHTVVEFFLTGGILGPLLLAGTGLAASPLAAVAAAASIAQIMNQVWKFAGLIRSEEFEKQASARLLSNELARLFVLRLALTAAGGIAMGLAELASSGFAAALAGEILGRYLFFVSVVPRNMAMTFFSQETQVA